MYDRIRRKWAGIVTGVTFAPNVPTTSAVTQEMDESAPVAAPRSSGWAPILYSWQGR